MSSRLMMPRGVVMMCPASFVVYVMMLKRFMSRLRKVGQRIKRRYLLRGIGYHKWQRGQREQRVLQQQP